VRTRIAASSILFYILLLLHLFVVIEPSAFVSHDGPSHLYNAHILNELLFSDNSIYHNYHAINPNWLQPNLSGYVLLCFFQLFLPFLWAEKLTVACYMLLMALGFRAYLKVSVADWSWKSVLIFPFLLNAVLFWGFYNFLLGLGLFFCMIAVYEKYRPNFKWNHLIVLVLLSLAVVYSHALVFIFGVIYIGVRELISIYSSAKNAGASILSSLKRSLFMFPGGALLLVYFLNKHEEQDGFLHYDFVSRLDRINFKIESLSFAGYSEGSFVVPMYAVFIILSIMRTVQLTKAKKWKPHHHGFLVVFFILAVLFTPDAASGGSIIVLRLNLMFFLFWLVWIAGMSLNKWSRGLLIFYSLCTIGLLNTRYLLIKTASLQCEHIIRASEPIMKPGTVFSTVYFKPIHPFIGPYQIHCYFELLSNIDHYAALAHRSVSLHNYEADRLIENSYFPVIWKDTAAFKTHLLQHNGKSLEYLDIEKFISKTGVIPAVQIRIGENSSGYEEAWDPKSRYQLQSKDSIGLLEFYSSN